MQERQDEYVQHLVDNLGYTLEDAIAEIMLISDET